jgi:hypothetical protein
MRAAISEQLQAYLRQHGRTVLTITLKPIRGSGSTVFEVLVDPHAPKHPDRYASFAQDGLCIYYSPQLGRRSELLELDYVRTLDGAQADDDWAGRPGGKRPHRAPERGEGNRHATSVIGQRHSTGCS